MLTETTRLYPYSISIIISIDLVVDRSVSDLVTDLNTCTVIICVLDLRCTGTYFSGYVR